MPLRRTATVSIALLLAGCIVVPRTADVYDPRCQTFVKQVVLETEVVGAIGHCHNDGCLAVLASMGIISAATAVVSGSIAVVGNILYWAERRGACPADAPAAGRPDASASAPPPVVPGIVPFPKEPR